MFLAFKFYLLRGVREVGKLDILRVRRFGGISDDFKIVKLFDR